MRLFVAIDIPEDVKGKVIEALREMERVWGGVRWVRRDGIHLTLKFLGEVEDHQLNLLLEGLKEVSAHHQPFPVDVFSLGRFPERGRPRVVWCGVREEKGSLKELAGEIETRMEKIGFKREERDFKAHVTLGRVRTPGGDEAGLKCLEKQNHRPFGSFEVDRFHLIKSTLLPDGARYEKLHSFELRKNP